MVAPAPSAPLPGVVPSGSPAATIEQSELQELSVKELRLRAAAAGVERDDIEGARDGHNPKQDVCPIRRVPHAITLASDRSGLIVQIIKLILAQASCSQLAAGGQASLAQAQAKAAERAAFKAELEQLGLKEVRLQAVAEGVDEDAIEDARDGDAPKECIIELILAKIAPM